MTDDELEAIEARVYLRGATRAPGIRTLLAAGEATGLEEAIDGARHMWLSGGVLRF